MTHPEFDLVYGGVPRFQAESPWAWRLVTRYARLLPARRRTAVRGRHARVSDAAGDSPVVLAHADPEAYLLPRAALRLVSAVARDRPLVIPVTNEPWMEEARRVPPFPYHTPALLAEAVEAVAAEDVEPVAVAIASSPVYAVRREALEDLPADLDLERVPEELGRRGLPALVDPGSYLHRYGALDAQAREDLASRIPAGARGVLDVGCSRGATAPLLRAAGVARIVGIEPEEQDAMAAASGYDQILPVKLEEVTARFDGEFDAILFGDVLEHLEDPSAALVRVRPWISERGVVVASLPHVGHWSVLADLLAGRFDYVPYSILSGTHLRFFTRRTVTDLFEACGYRIESIEAVTFQPSPGGRRALERLRAFPGASPDLEAAEFLVVARPDRNL